MADPTVFTDIGPKVSSTSETINGLTPNTSYDIEVVAFDDFGNTVSTNIVTIVTPNTIPGTPASVVLSDRAATSDVLSRSGADFFGTFSGTAATSDSLSRSGTPAPIALGDTAATSDALARSGADYTGSLSNTTATSDSLLPSGHSTPTSLGDSAATSDTVFRSGADFSVSISATAATSDSLSVTAAAASAAIGDTAVTAGAVSRSGADYTASLSDAATAADTLFPPSVATPTSLADTAITSDTLLRAGTDYAASLSDTAGSPDNLVAFQPTPTPTPQPPPVPTPTPTPAPTPAVPNLIDASAQSLSTTTVVKTETGFQTLLLDTQRWDLVLDASRNIAVASAPYSVAQDAASAVRLFAGELWYNTAPGVPYFASILGRQPPLGILKSAFVDAAKSVPDVTRAKAFISSLSNRSVTGQVQVTTTSGTTVLVSGVLQKAPAQDEKGNALTDEQGNVLFTVV